MTREEFIDQVDVDVVKPKVAKIPFIWRLLKGWMADNADNLVILLLNLILTSHSNPVVRKIGEQLIQLLKSKEKK